MSVIKLDTGFNLEVDFNLAPFFKRLLAWVIDLLICWLYVYIISYIFQVGSFFIFTDIWSTSGLLISLPVLFYHFLFEWLNNGQSPGKQLMSIQVVSVEGGLPGIAQYLLRWVFRTLDFAYIIPIAISFGQLPWWVFPLTFAGLFCVIFTRRSQRIGDYVAGTMLISLVKDTSWKDTVFMDIEEDYKPVYPQVMRLSDRDINTLKSIVQTVERNNDRDLALKIAEKVQTSLQIQTEEDPGRFLVTLLKDYNYYTNL